MVNQIKYIALLFLCIGVVSCSKKNEPISKIPLIELVSVSPQVVQEFRDSVIVTIRILDGDGDIGTQDPDATSLEVLDVRYDNPEHYHIPPFTPNGEELKITGTINVFIPTLLRFSEGSDNEQTTLELKIKDRAGNWSNVVTTQNIIITPYSGE